MGNTYQTRGVIGNVGLPVSGGIIREEHLNNEFTNIIAAFNASTGHAHNGTDSPRVTTLGANSELGTTTTAITPGSATIDVGTTGNKFRDAFYSGTVDAAIVKTAKLIDTNGRDSIILSATSTAVNQFTAANSATGNDITLSATGSDTNVSMVLTPKGSGLVKLAKDDLAIGGTAVTTTAAELNVLDGDVTSIGTTAVAGGDGIITNDNGTMRSTSVDTFDTYLSQTQKELTNKTLTSPTITTPQINDTSADHQYVFAVSELAADRTVTLPLLTGDDEFVFKDHTQTLTNKTLTTTNGINTGTGFVGIKNGGSQSELRLYCEYQNAHYLALQAPAHGVFGSGNKTLTFPALNDTLVSRTSTDTLTNKTIDVDDNPVSNIEVDNFKASAIVIESEGIGSNDNDTTLPTSAAVKDYVDTQVSGISADIEGVTAGTGLSGGGTTGTVTLNIDTSITADLSTAQTLTNKTLTSPKINENVALSSTATELNRLDGAFVGSASASKAVILSSGGNFINDIGSFKTQGFIDQGEYNSLSAGTHTLDWTNHGYIVILLTGNVTLVMGLPALVGGTGNESGVSAAAYCTLKVVQDGTGSRSITWPSSSVLKWAGGTAPTLTGTANSCDVFTFFCHDTAANGSLGSWYGFTAGLNVS